MKPIFCKTSILAILLLITFNINGQKFQGKAVYMSKSKMELGNWGARMSEAQKKKSLLV